jgi:octaprenyl-diphosphate synthase
MKVHREFAPELPEDIRGYLKQTLSRITSFKKEDFLIEELFKPSTHLLNKNGKLLRPTLLFLGASAIGVKGEDLVDLAAAIELLHISSLIHDDILDDGKLRRGVKSVNEEYGNNIALLAGNALISKAIHLSSEYGKEVMDAVSTTALQMSAGELLDYESKGNAKSVNVEEYLEIAKLKTAALTGTSCNIVAIYKKNKAESALYNYGFNVGIAFQIRDDILDFMEPLSASKERKSYANIVTLLKQKYGTDDGSALGKAAELNNYYIEQSLSGLKDKNMLGYLGPYAKMIEVRIN